jgi:hypothetical protein
VKKLLVLVALAITSITSTSPARAEDFYSRSSVEFCKVGPKTYVCAEAETWLFFANTILIGELRVRGDFHGQGYFYTDHMEQVVWSIMPATWSAWVKTPYATFCAHSSWHDVWSVHTAIPNHIFEGPPPPTQTVSRYARALRPNCDCGMPTY